MAGGFNFHSLLLLATSSSQLVAATCNQRLVPDLVSMKVHMLATRQHLTLVI